MRRNRPSAPAPSAGADRAPGFFSSYLWNSVAKLGDFGLAYVFAVLLARMLTPADYGTYIPVLSLATLVFVLSSMGIDKTLHRFLGEFAATPGTHKAPTLVQGLLGIRLGLIVVLVGAVVLGRDWIALRYENVAIAPLILAAALSVYSRIQCDGKIELGEALMNSSARACVRVRCDSQSKAHLWPLLVCS